MVGSDIGDINSPRTLEWIPSCLASLQISLETEEWRHVEWVFRNWFGFLHDAAEEWLDQQVPLESLRKRSRIAERRTKCCT